MLVPLLLCRLLAPPPDLLARARAAILVPREAPWPQARLVGKAKHYGDDDRYTFEFDAAGAFRQTFDGPIREVMAFDGKSCWEIDRSRAVERLDLEDRDIDLAAGLLLGSGWLLPGAPAKLVVAGDRLDLVLQPSGHVLAVSLDPDSGLPASATLATSSGPMTIRLSDWHALGNRKVPFHAEIAAGGQTDVIDVADADRLAAARKRFEMPSWTPDVAFAPGAPAKVEAKRALSGHMLVHPLIDGKDVGWFILDSGAEVMVIDREVAAQLKLAKTGVEPVTGIGGTLLAPFRLVPKFTLGPATIENVQFLELDVAGIGKLLGVKIAGLVGADFFRRADVSFDFADGSVQVLERAESGVPDSAWRPLRFSSGNPAVRAQAAGLPPAWFRLDTGANGTVVFHSPYVAANHLLDGRKTRPSGMAGVGGAVSARAGSLPWFELGGHRFAKPGVVFSTAKQGALDEGYLAGNIGQEFMLPFRIVFDFTGARVAFLPLPGSQK